MSIRRSLILSLENAEHQAEDTAILTEVEDLKIENEMQEAEKQVVEVSAENERISDAIDEGLDDVQQLTEVREQVEEVGGEAGISAESYQFVQAQVSRIYAKYGVNKALPSMESFNGYSGDRRYANRQLVTSMEEAEKGILRRIWDTLVKWARAAYDAVKGFLAKVGNTFTRAYEGLKTRLKNIKNFTLSKFKLNEGVAFGLLIDKNGKLLSSAGDFEKQIENTLKVYGTLTNTTFLNEAEVTKAIADLSAMDDKAILKQFPLVVDNQDNGNVGVVSKQTGLKNIATSVEMLGGEIAYTSTDKDSVEAGIYQPDVKFGGKPVEVVALAYDSLQKYLESFWKAVQELKRLQQNLDKGIKDLDAVGKKVLGEATDENKDAVSFVVKMLKANAKLTNKFATKFGKDANRFVTYVNKLYEAEINKDKKEENKDE